MITLLTRSPRQRLFAVFALLMLGLITLPSCKNSATSAESELIERVNAVHKQLMRQGNVSEEERLAILALASLVAQEEDLTDQRNLKGVLQVKSVDQAPVFPACEGRSGAELLQCFQEHLTTLVANEFNGDLASNLGIDVPRQVEVFSKVEEDGTLSNIKVRDADVVIQAEALRVIRLLPRMQPARHQDRVVPVICSTTITYGG